MEEEHFRITVRLRRFLWGKTVLKMIRENPNILSTMMKSSAPVGDSNWLCVDHPLNKSISIAPKSMQRRPSPILEQKLSTIR